MNESSHDDAHRENGARLCGVQNALAAIDSTCSAHTTAIEEAKEALAVIGRTCSAQVAAVQDAKAALASAMDQLAADRRLLASERWAMFAALEAEQAKGKAEVEQRRKHLAKERSEFEEKKAILVHVGEDRNDTVLLDVGGVQYKTSRKILTAVSGSMLDTMFSGRDETRLLRDANGRVFIDRDGTLFGRLLSFLSYGLEGDCMDGLSEAQRCAVQHEAAYFGLEDAMFPDSMVPMVSRVIVIGGNDGQRDLDSVEVLDLASMTFGAGPPMGQERTQCAVVLLDASRLLVAGGRQSFFTCLDSTEVLDLEQMDFSPGPRMGAHRAGAAAVLLDQGKALLVGGYNGQCLETTEVLDLATMLFAPSLRLGLQRCGCAAVMLGTDRCLVVGGHDDATFHDTTELIDVATMRCSTGPRMGSRRAFCASVMLDVGRFVVAGGCSDSLNSFDTTEELDVGTMTFGPGPRMGAVRGGCAAVSLDKGLVLVVGGRGGNAMLETTEVFDLTTTFYTPGPAMGRRRMCCGAQAC